MLMEQSEPLEEMRKSLQDWLSSADWKPTRLIRWLEGFDLPAFGHMEEPYIWLLRGLPPGGDRFRAETALALRAAALLDAEPDRSPVGERPERVLYNLLMLCTGLSCPDQLAEPLWRMYLRVRERREGNRLERNWRGFSLRGALRSALVENQLDNRMERVWFSMLEGADDDILPRDSYDGFAGIVQMPSRQEGRGYPAVAEIGRALGLLARRLEIEVREGYRAEFLRLLRQTLQTYPDRGGNRWSIDLLRAADREAWPAWSVQCLPSLFLLLGSRGDGIFALWKYYALLLPGFDYSTARHLCDGAVVLLQLAPESERFLSGIVPRLEEVRTTTREDSERAVLNLIFVQELGDIEIELSRDDRRSAEIVRHGREAILRYEGGILIGSGLPSVMAAACAPPRV
jgi:hypothetical protein